MDLLRGSYIMGIYISCCHSTPNSYRIIMIIIEKVYAPENTVITGNLYIDLLFKMSYTRFTSFTNMNVSIELNTVQYINYGIIIVFDPNIWNSRF